MKIFKCKKVKVMFSLVLSALLFILGLYVSVRIAGIYYVDTNVEYPNSHLDYFKKEN